MGSGTWEEGENRLVMPSSDPTQRQRSWLRCEVQPAKTSDAAKPFWLFMLSASLTTTGAAATAGKRQKHWLCVFSFNNRGGPLSFSVRGSGQWGERREGNVKYYTSKDKTSGRSISRNSAQIISTKGGNLRGKDIWVRKGISLLRKRKGENRVREY